MSDSTKSKLNKNVFISATVIICGLLLFTLVSPEYAGAVFQQAQANIVTNGSWFYVLTVAIILSFVCYLALSKYGLIKLGEDHETPDYSLASWLAMLFAAGMGIGLMFFGVAEPLMHFLAPPDTDPQSLEAVKSAMTITFFHWGIHAWAVYAVVALILGYYSYRLKLPLTLRSSLYPFIGNKIFGWQGNVVDTFAVVSTVFGVATSLGLGASQINSGLNYIFGTEVSVNNQIILMMGIIALAAVSVATGLDRGIKILSETNLVMAIALMLMVFMLGSSVFLLQAYVQNIGAYISDMVRLTFNLYAYEPNDWVGGWTIFYWGWWIAWAPFVGLFIARISRGRTIREFVLGVMIIPTAFTLLWMTIFGNSAIDLVFNQGVTRLAEMVSQDSSVALFVFLENYPMTTLITGLSLLMIVIFFVTSCDSGAMVIDMICSDGNNETPLWQRLYWAIAIGLVACLLSLVGGLQALQTMTIVAALPFAIILLIAMVGLFHSMRIEAAKRLSLQTQATPPIPYNTEEDWQERLVSILEFPSQETVSGFIDKRVAKAFTKLTDTFNAQGFNAHIDKVDDGLELRVDLLNEQDFVYRVIAQDHVQPHFANESNDAPDQSHYYRAEVHLKEGGQDYDIMGWSTTGIINDVIDQYHKHMHFLHILR